MSAPRLTPSSSQPPHPAMDDEVQYLGTKPAPSRSALDISSFTQKAAIGIALHDHTSTLSRNKAFVNPLKFYKKDAAVVHIGRRSSSEAQAGGSEKDRALFRCAVVSRTHAKIAFTDSGSAYLIDLNSHHGTHHRKSSEIVSKPLKPETPTALSDGDIITFGKPVGRDDDIVSPVVVRVELLYGPNPVDAPASVSPRPVATGCIQVSRSTDSTRSRGRYGLYASLYSSRDNSPSRSTEDESDDDDDKTSDASVKEIDERSPSPRPSQSTNASSWDVKVTGGLGSKALEAFKNFLPPVRIHRPPIVIGGSIAGTSDGRRSPSVDRRHQSPLPGSDDNETSDSSYYSASPSESSSSVTSSPGQSTTSINASDCRALLDDARALISIGTPHDKDLDDRLKSHSPMELATPTPTPPPLPRLPTPPQHLAHSIPYLPPLDPFLWGDPWGSGRTRFFPGVPVPTLPPLPPVLNPSIDRDNCLGLVPKAVVPAPDITLEESSIRVIECDQPAQPVGETSSRATDTNEPTVDPVVPVVPFIPESELFEEASGPPPNQEQEPSPSGMQELTRTVSQLKSEVAKLQQYRRKYRAKFNSNVQTVSQQMSDLDDRINDQNMQYDSLSDQVQSMTDDLPGIQSRLDSLEDDLTSAEDQIQQGKSERDETKSTVSALKELVEEMKVLQESTCRRMEKETEAASSARDTVLESLKALQEQVQGLKSRFDEIEAGVQAHRPELFNTTVILPPSPAASPVRPNKRKRVEEDEEDQVEGTEDVDLQMNAECPPESTTADGESPAVPSTTAPVVENAKEELNSTLVQDRDGTKVPSPKRARRVVNAVLQTAGAVTLGAVVTWSALAFA
ncbi:hypothetical protein AX16_002109 [Volvariella volvacea WC 439]|nr:hypothetical protein AX16_002109 [Volvariella volvacea WC 439]